jgi:hypothetical protein
MVLSVVIGEFLYNLRSALDNLVCALVRIGRNGSSCSGRGFPIHTDCDKFDAEAARKLRGVPPSARALIQGLQPYSRGNLGATIDPLNILNLLRNKDTHRALNLAVNYHRNTSFRVLETSTRRALASVTIPETLYLSQGAQTIPLPFPASDMPSEVKVQAAGSTGIAFLEDGPWGDRKVNDVLVSCLDYVERGVVARFMPFFN